MLSLALIAGFSTCLMAQAEPGSANMENRIAPADNISIPTDTEDSADNLLSKFIKTSGIQAASEQGLLTYATSASPIGVPASSPKYVDARNLAFEKAIFNAKVEIAKSLASKVSRKVAASMAEGPDTKISSDSPAAQATMNAIREKINEQLKAKGIDTKDKEAVKKNLDEILASDEFQQSMEAAGSCFLTGCQIFKTFTTKDEVGIVIIHNEPLMALAESMFTGKAIESKGAGGAKLSTYIPTDNLEWFNSYGVRLVRDENGNNWLLCYTQAQVIGRNTSRAFAKAELLAKGLLASFAGEKTVYSNALEQAGSTATLAEMGDITSITSGFKQKAEAEAKNIKVNGMLQVDKKVITLASGHKVALAVYKWSPASAAMAQKAVERMNQVQSHKNEASAPVAPAKPVTPQAPQYQDKRHTGEGASGILF